MIDTVAITVALSATLAGGHRAALELARPAPPEPVEQVEPAAEAPETDAPAAPAATGDATEVEEREGAGPRARRTADRPAARDSDVAPAGSFHRPGPKSYSVSGATAAERTPPPPATAPPNAGPGSPDGDTILYYDVRIFGGPNGTNTGYKEDFMVYEGHPTQDRPLLIVFHRFGVGYLDAFVHTKFFQEARLRDWHVLAPLSASGVHFGSIEGQIGTEKAIEWTLNNLNVDTDRIYAVGFSMGAGAALNFAARHTDPDRYMFAAVADHTGGISIPNAYVKEPAVQFILDFWFGNGTPGSADPWKMKRSSSLDFDPLTLVVDPTTDLARNITHMPVKVWRASNEPQLTAYLSEECDVFVSHLQSRGGTVGYEIVPYFEHEWDLLDENEALQWLGQHTLQVPTTADTLADHDGTYFHFEVTQDAPNAFTPFSWDTEPPAATNKLRFWDTANLQSLKVDAFGAGLDPNTVLEIELSTADGLGDEIVLSPWPFPPSAVYRDGVQVFQNWSYDDQSRELTILEHEGAQTHNWGVHP